MYPNMLSGLHSKTLKMHTTVQLGRDLLHQELADAVQYGRNPCWKVVEVSLPFAVRRENKRNGGG
jgi:hypothetical protein